MGYYTRYHIDSKTDGVTREQAEQLALAVVEPHYGNPFDDSCKWYDHDEHMKEVSEKNPDIVFELFGEGEESGDIWYKYYKNGKKQVCQGKVTFEEYDESKLV